MLKTNYYEIAMWFAEIFMKILRPIFVNCDLNRYNYKRLKRLSFNIKIRSWDAQDYKPKYR